MLRLSLYEPHAPLFHRLEQDPVMRKGVPFMRIVVVKLPKMLCGLARKIFHMDR